MLTYGPPLTEKIDVWKLPDMILHVLLKNPSGMKVKKELLAVINTLKPILERCKNYNPKSRPTADEIVEKMYEIMHNIETLGW